MTEITEYPDYQDLEDAIDSPGQAVDLAAAAVAVRQFLAALGISCDSPGMWDSPQRMARAYAEMFTARPFDMTTFPNDAGYDDLVVVKAIPVRSVCEHHLLPFLGHATVGYRPADRIIGLSKFARVVIEAEHTCMTARGVQAGGSVTTTAALSGVLRDDPRSRAEFLAAVRGSTQFS
jgi:GTP cyclohydrolase IA